MLWTYVINDLNGDEIIGTFYEKKLQKIKVELDLSNYATKTDLKKATGVDTSSFVKNLI